MSGNGHRPRKPTRSASPVVRTMVEAADASGISYVDICQDAGIYIHALTGWKTGRHEPGLLGVESVLAVLGYELVVRKRD